MRPPQIGNVKRDVAWGMALVTLALYTTCRLGLADGITATG